MNVNNNFPKLCHRKLTMPASSLVDLNGAKIDARLCEGQRCAINFKVNNPADGSVTFVCGDVIAINSQRNLSDAVAALTQAVQAMGLHSGALKIETEPTPPKA